MTKVAGVFAPGHTWGRFQNGKAVVKVKNVDWPVPQIIKTLYEVEQLPKIFKQQKWQTEYLWIDLFCIPQGEENKEARDSEMERQQYIFGNCKECIVWLNDIDVPWDVVPRALQWLSAKYLVANKRSDVDGSAAALLVRLRDSTRADIDFLANIVKEISVEKYSSWFSSTWTVQETFYALK